MSGSVFSVDHKKTFPLTLSLSKDEFIKTNYSSKATALTQVAPTPITLMGKQATLNP